LFAVGVGSWLAGSLAEFFHHEGAEERSAEAAAAGPVRVPDELTALQGELRAVERRWPTSPSAPAPGRRTWPCRGGSPVTGQVSVHTG
jgi:hypothetical protein